MVGQIKRSRGAAAYRRAAHSATIPRNTVAPAVTGTAQVAQTLTTTNGTWAGNAATYTRQWKRGGTVDIGTGALTYVPVAADVGFSISCVVTATNSTGSVSATSNSTAAVIA